MEPMRWLVLVQSGKNFINREIMVIYRHAITLYEGLMSYVSHVQFKPSPHTHGYFSKCTFLHFVKMYIFTCTFYQMYILTFWSVILVQKN